MYCFFWILFWPFIRLLFPVKIVGKENLKKVDKKSAILICNHLSNADPVLIASYIRRKISFLAKREIFKNKLAGWFFRSIGIIPIDRENIDIKAIKSALTVLKNDGVLGIFPEGTRNKKDEELKEIKNGCCMFAIKAKVPVVPIIIQKRAQIFRKTKITIGEPFELSEFYGSKLSTEVLNEAGQIVVDKLKVLYD